MIEYYDNPETAPYRRYQRFNALLANRHDTGDDYNSLDNRLNRALGYIGADDRESAIKELSNLRLVVHNIKNEIGIDALANAVMVKSIGGVPCDDLTYEGLVKTVELMSKNGVSKNVISKSNEAIKKKYNSISKRISKIFFKGKTLPSTLA